VAKWAKDLLCMAERNRLNQEGVVIHNLDISLSKKIYKKFLHLGFLVKTILRRKSL